jgi:transcriptional regulator with XRE-family HTH domain
VSVMKQGSAVARPRDISGVVEASQTSGDTGSSTTTFALPDPDGQRRAELALFLKAKRAAIAPESIGLRTARHRRARGLLREEVAQRAGISPTWYTWLEQGREIKPSAEVLEHLADALLLTESERDHLLTLARPEASARRQRSFSSTVPHPLKSWLHGLHQPAYVLNGRWDVLAWNGPAKEILGDFASVPSTDRNILRMIFLWTHWRGLFVEWACLAASSVAQFRAETARYAGDEELETFIRKLGGDSADFARLWNDRQIDAPQLRVKRMHHATLGTIDLTYAPLQPKGLAGDLSVVVYSPQGA